MVIAGNARARARFAEAAARIDTSDPLLWFAVFVPVVALYLLTLRVDGGNMITDTVSVTPSAWHLAHHGTPRIPLGTPIWDAWIIPSGPGHVISNREPGLIGLAAIFYFVFHSASIFDVTPASLAAALVTAAAVATLTLVARRLVSARAALVAGLLIGAGTSTWSISGTSLFPHGPDQLYLALAMLAVAGGRYALAGIPLALAVLTRPPLAIAAAVLGIWHSVTARSVRPALWIGALSGAGLALLLWYSHEFWGGGLQSQYTATGMGGDYSGRFTDVGPGAWGDFVGNIFGTLISPGRGIVFGSPFLVVLAFGLRRAWAAAPPWVRSSAAAGILYMLFQLKASRFQGGSPFWGYRYPIEMLTLLVPLLVLSWREYVAVRAQRQALFAALAVLSVAWQALGATCFRGSGNGTVVWAFSDLQSAFSDHPVACTAILAVGCGLSLTAFWRVERAAPAT